MKIDIYYHDKPVERVTVVRYIEIKADTIIINRNGKQWLQKLLTNNIK